MIRVHDEELVLVDHSNVAGLLLRISEAQISGGGDEAIIKAHTQQGHLAASEFGSRRRCETPEPCTAANPGRHD